MERSGDVEYLVGEFERSVDGNSRLSLPASIAAYFDGEAVLSDDPEGCVRISIASAYEQYVADLMDKFRRGEISRDELRAKSSASRVVKIDKQGRITLDENARSLAGVRAGSEVVVVGAFDSIEIWRPSRYRVKRGEAVEVQDRRVWDDEDEETDDPGSGH